MVSIVERVKRIIEHYSLSDSAFAAKCGIRQNTIWYQLEGKRQLNLKTVVAILSVFDEISAEWLMSGKGNMIKDNNSVQDYRVNALIDTITMLQQTVVEKSKIINLLENKIKER